MTGLEQDFGIFIKEIISKSLADRDGMRSHRYS